MFKTIKEDASGEIIEKKSRFIANIFYIESEEEAEKIIKSIRKKYYDARHNCFAYRIRKIFLNLVMMESLQEQQEHQF